MALQEPSDASPISERSAVVLVRSSSPATPASLTSAEDGASEDAGRNLTESAPGRANQPRAASSGHWCTVARAAPMIVAVGALAWERFEQPERPLRQDAARADGSVPRGVAAGVSSRLAFARCGTGRHDSPSSTRLGTLGQAGTSRICFEMTSRSEMIERALSRAVACRAGAPRAKPWRAGGRRSQALIRP